MGKDTINILFKHRVVLRSGPLKLKEGVHIAEAYHVPVDNYYTWVSVKHLKEKSGAKIWQEIETKFTGDGKMTLEGFGVDPTIWAGVLSRLKAARYFLDGPCEFGPKIGSRKLNERGDISGDNNASWICVDEKRDLHFHVTKFSEATESKSAKKVLVALIGNTGN